MSATRPTILLTGRDGQVGHALRRALAPLGEVFAVDKGDVDLTDLGALRALVRRARPALLVNAAAYTDVDAAETDETTARAVNALAPAVLAEEARRLGAPMVHYSTDYVFDGSKGAPYRETDATAPLGVYGRTKLEGEVAVRESGARHIILRLAWVYGPRGRNFLVTMLRLGRSRPELRVVDDQVGAPTASGAVASATALLCHGLLRGHGPEGTYHLPARGEVSWHGFAEAIFQRAPRHLVPSKPRVVAIPTAEYPTPARRPAYSVLDGSALRAATGLHLPHWREQLDRVLEDPGLAAALG